MAEEHESTGGERFSNVPGPPPEFDPRAAEADMYLAWVATADMEFGSIAERLDHILTMLETDGAPPPASVDKTPADQAQMLVYKAIGLTGKRRAQLAQTALRTHPDCADAHVLLAEETAGDLEQARDMYTEAVAAGERAVADAIEEHTGDLWSYLPARGFMRALKALAETFWRAGAHDEAITHFQRVLRLDEGDHQTTGPQLLTCMSSAGRYSDADMLADELADREHSHWLYADAYRLFAEHGATEDANRALVAAVECNPVTAVFLAAGPAAADAFGDDPPHPMAIMDALIYLQRCHIGWFQRTDALAWVVERLDATFAQPKPGGGDVDLMDPRSIGLFPRDDE